MNKKSKTSKTVSKTSKNNWNNQKNQKNKQNQKSFKQEAKRPVFDRKTVHAVTKEEIEENEKAIFEFKSKEVICPYCGQVIKEIAGAMCDKQTGEPIHFDCALKIIHEKETLTGSEKIAYIGQGRFGVIQYDNPKDFKHFTIKKIIEWEDRDKSYEWRDNIAGLYSHVK